MNRRTLIEKEVAAIWMEVLGLPEVSTDADFLELGGDSIAAVQITSRVRARLSVELPIELVFAGARSVAEMCRAIESRQIKHPPYQP